MRGSKLKNYAVQPRSPGLQLQRQNKDGRKPTKQLPSLAVNLKEPLQNLADPAGLAI
jgi:hypothetical protein